MLLRGVIKPKTATNITAPIIDQTTGKSVPPMLNTKKSGSANFLAIQLPSKAPINPTAIESKHPPLENPTNA